MRKPKLDDKILTVQVHHKELNPRTFQVPLKLLNKAALFAWLLVIISIISTVFAIRAYYFGRVSTPEYIFELQNEVQELKISLEKKTDTSDKKTTHLESGTDQKASDQKPTPGLGEPVEAKEGPWQGLAQNVTVVPKDQSTIEIQDSKIEWQGKYAHFSANVIFKNPGKGSQQGHIVALGRANDRIFAHPEGVLNTSNQSFLFEPDRGEFFSVTRFRVLKAHFGPFDSVDQLSEIQLFIFDLNQKLILNRVFHYEQ